MLTDSTQWQALAQAFLHYFSQPHQWVFQAPGRVNLIGEHTDYNDGFVLPCAINFYTRVLATPNQSGKIRVLAHDYQQQDEFDLNSAIEPHPLYSWANYVRGVANCLIQQGYALKGCDIAISGNVPKGAGLSSSASLEVALGLCFSQVSGFMLSGRDNALNGQKAENQFVGCLCGIMDQLICALGQQGKALLIDTRSLQSTAVSIPQKLKILIINSNIQRGLVDSAYNERRQQCEQAAKKLGVKRCGISVIWNYASRNINCRHWKPNAPGMWSVKTTAPSRPPKRCNKVISAY